VGTVIYVVAVVAFAAGVLVGWTAYDWFEEE
jgi:hypothetical protein